MLGEALIAYGLEPSEIGLVNRHDIDDDDSWSSRRATNLHAHSPRKAAYRDKELTVAPTIYESRTEGNSGLPAIPEEENSDRLAGFVPVKGAQSHQGKRSSSGKRNKSNHNANTNQGRRSSTSKTNMMNHTGPVVEQAATETVHQPVQWPGRRFAKEVTTLPIYDEIVQLLETKHNELCISNDFPAKYYALLFNLVHSGLLSSVELAKRFDEIRRQLIPPSIGSKIDLMETALLSYGDTVDNFAADKVNKLFKTLYFIRAPSTTMFDQLKQFLREQEANLTEVVKNNAVVDNFVVRKTIRAWADFKDAVLFWREK